MEDIARFLLFPLLGALIGAFSVYLLGLRTNALSRRAAYIEKQLSDFYSPLAAYRKRIRAKSELRERISVIANEAWQEICEPYSRGGHVFHEHKERFVPFEKIIEYDNQQFEQELLPYYRKMLEIFTDKYWLADPDTRAYYQDYLEYVEIWGRFMARSLPREVHMKIKHAEERILAFYKHVEERMEQLRQDLKDERFVGFRVAGLTINSGRPAPLRRIND